MTQTKENRYINRELSWLQFNARVLQEAADESVPLIERFRFLGIFSNNLDEFFKVRYATVRRIVDAGKTGRKALGVYSAEELLGKITEIVIEQQTESLQILEDIYKKLEEQNIYMLTEEEVTLPEHKEFIKDFFTDKVALAVETIILREDLELPRIQDLDAYLMVKMNLTEEQKPLYALLEIPSTLDRFVVLPQVDGKDYIMILDDLIRYNLDTIFSIFEYDSITAHMIKITRDAELDIESDLGKSFLEKLTRSVKGREDGEPVRFVFDKTIEEETLQFLLNKLGIKRKDSIIPGGRYHNRKDYMNFPAFGRQELYYPSVKPLPIPGITLEDNLFSIVAKKDFLQYTPYQSFSYTIKFLREAALDPKVRSIKITIYRLAKLSSIASALINAAQNGKEVTVQIELRARFDEESNMRYAKKMQNEGVRLIFGVPGLKVHSKVCVIEREEEGKIVRYGFISTGNFNHATARIYTDYTLFTANKEILKDLSKLFNFFDTNYIVNKYKHLVVSPHYSRTRMYKLIQEQIEIVQNGGEGLIRLKLNSISNYDIIDKLYEASQAGVKIQMIVRGICCLIPGVPGMSENIEIISIIDKFLEHPRVYIFGIPGEEKVFLSSSDWMSRNLDNRVEVSVPIYDEDIKQEIIDTHEISWSDNVKARVLNKQMDNRYKKDDLPFVRSQFATYEYYVNKLKDL
ncbi:polyphosphate kinase 1 [Dokdonia donghaensis]|jgi:polyphosphate kinase|uniref:Polyphosphate kinase n=2 Tax=Dokdonia TaxID=326319 RepID=A0A0A2GSW9_9FLAO|nr:polyphosphate kinase 1 [Dokdonia donghaensis]ANH61160.1 Polyphosphate kinase [Dokdonia donghaensis DSW-1]AOE09607.1 polyphosphate kinase [uncultured bacterium]KGO05628.1 polyphosphate kinase [Dokdonia donghaensis DSW-1]CCF99656.1 polyphosphate kinase [uncultured Dokdonia sp.]